VRIALATSSYAPYIGGVEEHVRNVARVLRARGHDVVVWTVSRDGAFAVREIDGIAVWELPTPLPDRSIRGAARFAVNVPRAMLLWWRAVRSFRPHLIHVHCFGPNGSYVRRLSKATRIPFVLSAHGETLADDVSVFTASRLAASDLRRGLSEAVAVTGCSRVAVDDLVARFGLDSAKGTVVFNGIELDELIGVLPAGVGGRYIAAVGRIQRLKGFDLLLEAFARAGLPPDIRLVVGGGGAGLAELRVQAQRLGIDDRVVLPGWLDRPTVGALRRGALIGVVPSRSEPFGIAALEVWRAGSALIATTRGGPPEFVRDGIDGVLVDPEDVGALARAIGALVAEPQTVARLAEAGRKRVRSFTWENTVDAYERVYRGILTRDSASPSGTAGRPMR